MRMGFVVKPPTLKGEMWGTQILVWARLLNLPHSSQRAVKFREMVSSLFHDILSSVG